MKKKILSIALCLVILSMALLVALVPEGVPAATDEALVATTFFDADALVLTGAEPQAPAESTSATSVTLYVASLAITAVALVVSLTNTRRHLRRIRQLRRDLNMNGWTGFSLREIWRASSPA